MVHIASVLFSKIVKQADNGLQNNWTTSTRKLQRPFTCLFYSLMYVFNTVVLLGRGMHPEIIAAQSVRVTTATVSGGGNTRTPTADTSATTQSTDYKLTITNYQLLTQTFTEPILKSIIPYFDQSFLILCATVHGHYIGSACANGLV